MARGNIIPIKRAQAIDSDNGLPLFLVSRKTQMAEPPKRPSSA